MNKVWKDHERKFIKDNAAILTDKELSIKLTQMCGRTVTIQAVRKQRQKAGIKKERGRGICKVVGQKEDIPVIGRAVNHKVAHGKS